MLERSYINTSQDKNYDISSQLNPQGHFERLTLVDYSRVQVSTR